MHIADLERVKLEGELLRGTGGGLASATLTVQHICFSEGELYHCLISWLFSDTELQVNVKLFVIQVPVKTEICGSKK